MTRFGRSVVCLLVVGSLGATYAAFERGKVHRLTSTLTDENMSVPADRLNAKAADTSFLKTDVGFGEREIGSFITVGTAAHWRSFALLKDDPTRKAVNINMVWDSSTIGRHDDIGCLSMGIVTYDEPTPDKDVAGLFYFPDKKKDALGNFYVASMKLYVCLVETRVEHKLTVDGLKNFIAERKMHDFFFNDGAGCRFWQITLLDELAKASYVPANAADVLEDQILHMSKELAKRDIKDAKISLPTALGQFRTFVPKRNCESVPLPLLRRLLIRPRCPGR